MLTGGFEALEAVALAFWRSRFALITLRELPLQQDGVLVSFRSNSFGGGVVTAVTTSVR